MPRHFATFVAANASPGVILIPRLTPIGIAIGKLLDVWLAWNTEDLANQIWWL